MFGMLPDQNRVAEIGMSSGATSMYAPRGYHGRPATWVMYYLAGPSIDSRLRLDEQVAGNNCRAAM
jgi:hypothetical protein